MRTLNAPLALFLSVFLCLGAAVSCGSTNCKDPANATSAKCTAVNAFVDCGGSAIDTLVTTEGPSLQQALGSAIEGDGSINYTAAEPTLEDFAVKFGMCFVTRVFSDLGNIKLAAAPGSASSPHASPQALKDTLEKFRATHYTGKGFKVGGAP